MSPYFRHRSAIQALTVVESHIGLAPILVSDPGNWPDDTMRSNIWTEIIPNAEQTWARLRSGTTTVGSSDGLTRAFLGFDSIGLIPPGTVSQGD